MRPTKNDLPKATRESMIVLLNARLADAFDLYSQVKQAHWNVRGPNFIGLHKLFDEVAYAVLEHVDMIAEQAAQLGGTAMGTARMAAKATQLKEYPSDIISCEDHANAVSDRLAQFGKLVREGIDEADKAGDADTADLFTEISRSIDKYRWFVESHVE